jgi:predicted transcriptional regulator
MISAISLQVDSDALIKIAYQIDQLENQTTIHQMIKITKIYF